MIIEHNVITGTRIFTEPMKEKSNNNKKHHYKSLVYLQQRYSKKSLNEKHKKNE